MLPWLIDLGLGVVDLGLVAAGIAVLFESVGGRPSAARRECEANAESDAE